MFKFKKGYFITNGVHETQRAFLYYQKDYAHITNLTKIEIDNDLPITTNEWYNRNHFITMINKKTTIIYGIRDFDDSMPDPSSFLFISDYLPFRVPMQPCTKSDLLIMGLQSIAVYNSEVSNAMEQAKENGKKALFVYDVCGEDGFYAYSFDDKEMMIVEGLNENHLASQIESEIDNIIFDPKEYYIYYPSKEFMNIIPLNLDYPS